MTYFLVSAMNFSAEIAAAAPAPPAVIAWREDMVMNIASGEYSRNIRALDLVYDDVILVIKFDAPIKQTRCSEYVR